MLENTLPRSLEVLEWSKSLLLIGVLVYTSALDLRFREVEPKLWLYVGAPLALISLYEALHLPREISRVMLMVNAVGSAIILASVAALCLAGMMGGGDLFALLVIEAAHPWPFMLSLTPIPFLVLVMIYTASSFLVIIPLMIAYNLLANRAELKRIDGFWNKVVAASTAIPVRVGDYVESKSWFFPLEDYREGRRVFRRSFDVDEDPQEHRNAMRKLISEGLLREDQRIWVTYGIPFLVPLTIGYVASIMVGGAPVLSLIKALR